MTTTMQFTEESTSRFADSKPWRIHYNEAGEGHPVIMHPRRRPRRHRLEQLRPEHECWPRSTAAIAVDMPGWGESGAVDVRHARTTPLPLLSFMDALGIEKAAFVGNSMGGAATLSFAVEYPDRISHIVTMGSAPVGGMTHSCPAAARRGHKVLSEAYEDPSLGELPPPGPRHGLRLLLRHGRAAAAALRVGAVAPEHLRELGRGATRDAASGGPPLPSGPTVLHRLTKLDIPALIIHGRDDRTMPLETSLQILAALPNSRMLIFNRCGHWAQLEHAAGVQPRGRPLPLDALGRKLLRAPAVGALNSRTYGLFSSFTSPPEMGTSLSIHGLNRRLRTDIGNFLCCVG